MPAYAINKNLTKTVVLLAVAAVCSCSDFSGGRVMKQADSLSRYWSELIHQGNFEEVRASAGPYYARAKADGDDDMLVRAGIYLGQAYTDVPDSIVHL